MESDFCKEPYKWVVRVRIKKGQEVAYGGGVSYLLQQTAKTGSLLSAAKHMGMSYRKALQIVKQAEKQLGHTLLKKTVGGTGGGGSELTEFAKDFVYRFRDLEQEVQAYAEQLAQRHFSQLFWEESTSQGEEEDEE